jgi:glutamate N-acetyltransferase/amino-acid N-acetyltransferase
MTYSVPAGFRVSGVHCGIKRNPNNPDLTLIVCDSPCVAAGVYTQNLVCAAPVVLDRQRTPTDRARIVAINSGCANACTGERGDRDASEMARLAAAAVGAEERSALVMSTGIIGEHLPMERIAQGIAAGAEQLADDDDALIKAARGILTTDLVHKLSGRTLEVGGRSIHITGMAKGSGMIGPRMATMLAVIMTDAALRVDAAQAALATATEKSFNCVSVDGHTSTNDTALLLASGAAGEPLAGADLDAFQRALDEVCIELARAIADDGEGATHLITVDVVGCATAADAAQIARTIADSPLVKTAVAGADPNWGRIVSAAGYSGVAFDPLGVALELNGALLYDQGQPVEFDAEAVSDSIRADRETHILLRLREGQAEARFWTCDLTAQYVSINADYHT